MMKCAVSDHLLVDGVLVEDKYVVSFIRKRVAEFRTMEEICRKCKEEITKIYREKQKRARALQKASLHDSSLSSLSASTSSSHDRMQKSLEEENAPILGNVSKNANFSKQPITSKDATSGVFTLSSNVTTRKRNNPDYLKGKSADTNSSKRISHDSERPTTSKAAAAAASTESPITDVIIDSEDDEPRYSLNAFNGTRLPNVQPILPKRKPRTDLSRAELALIEYARDITGG